MTAIPLASHSLIPFPSYGYHDSSIRHDTLSSPSDDLKKFFIGLHSFNSPRRRSESGNSSLSSSSSSGSSTLVSSDDDDTLSIFSSDKEAYDFESQLPSSVLTSIQQLLDERDKFDEDFEKSPYKELNPEAPLFVPDKFDDFKKFRCRELNPKAPSFVPSGTVPDASLSQPLEPSVSLTALHNDPPPTFSSVALPLLPHSLPARISHPKSMLQAPWLAVFAAASSTAPTAFSVLASHAVDLAHANIWHTTALGELSQHFLWTACAPEGAVTMATPPCRFRDSVNGSVAIRETMAPFAMEVYRALFDTYGEETALSFVWHLRESVVGTFKAAWCAQKSTKAISYHFPPSSEYILSATHLCAFIGNLFRFNLVLIQHIRLCLSILMQELNSLEHVTAVGVLIEHAGPRMWCHPSLSQVPKTLVPGVQVSMAEFKCDARVLLGDALDSEVVNVFKREFLAKTAGLQNGSSVLLRNVVPGVCERDERVREVMDVLARCCGGLQVEEAQMVV